jgi:hypothetical protein
VESVARGNLIGMAQRLVSALRGGSYPVGKTGYLRSHQLLEACARSPLIQRQYLDLLQGAVARVAAAIGESQRRGLLRDDLDAAALSKLALALFVGLRTLREIDMPLDLSRMLLLVLRLLARKGGR